MPPEEEMNDTIQQYFDCYNTCSKDEAMSPALWGCSQVIDQYRATRQEAKQEVVQQMALDEDDDEGDDETLDDREPGDQDVTEATPGKFEVTKEQYDFLEEFRSIAERQRDQTTLDRIIGPDKGKAKGNQDKAHQDPTGDLLVIIYRPARMSSTRLHPAQRRKQHHCHRQPGIVLA